MKEPLGSPRVTSGNVELDAGCRGRPSSKAQSPNSCRRWILDGLRGLLGGRFDGEGARGRGPRRLVRENAPERRGRDGDYLLDTGRDHALLRLLEREGVGREHLGAVRDDGRDDEAHIEACVGIKV